MVTVIKIPLKSGKIGFYMRFTDIDGHRKTRATKARNDDEAARAAQRCEDRLRNGQCGDFRDEAKAKAAAKRAAEASERARITVDELCDKFCAEYSADVADIKYYRRQAKSALKAARAELGSADARTLKRADVVRARDKLLADLKSNRVVSRTLVQLGRVFQWAIERELLDVNPIRGVRKPKCNSSTSFYSDRECGLILAWAKKNDAALYPIVATALYTGMRRGELASLRWCDVDFAGERIVVARSWKRQARKSGRMVMVALHPDLEEILRAHRTATSGVGDGLVFPDPANGRMRDKFDLWGLGEAIKAINAEATGENTAATVRRFRAPWHAMRHTHATRLASSGAGLTVIRDALGQSTLHMAGNYTHLAAEQVAAHVRKLPALRLVTDNVRSHPTAVGQGVDKAATGIPE